MTREDTAGFAADAYARMKGIGVALVTYGVGIGVLNSTCEAYAENSPLVVISGSPGKEEYKKHSQLHHLVNRSHTELGDTTQVELFKRVTIDQAVLNDPLTAFQLINRILDQCVHNKKPVYLELPRDMVDANISKTEYRPIQFPKSNTESITESLQEINSIVQQCNRPFIWCGKEVLSYNLTQHVLQFAEKHRIPIASTLLGKSCVDETHDLYMGVYQGELSADELKDFVNECDCILMIGCNLDDVNSGQFTLPKAKYIQLGIKQTRINHHYYPDILLSEIVPQLSKLDTKKFSFSFPVYKNLKKTTFTPKEGQRITAARLTECIQSVLDSNVNVVSDIGDCMYVVRDLVLHQNSFMVSSFYESLGSGTPQAVGFAFADRKKKVLAVVGDGGFQMSGTELSAALRYKLGLVVVVMNNHGYSTERQILDGPFNDLVDWHYSELPKLLGGGVGKKVKDESEVHRALKEAVADKSGVFHLIEVDLDQKDFTPALRQFGSLVHESH